MGLRRERKKVAKKQSKELISKQVDPKSPKKSRPRKGSGKLEKPLTSPWLVTKQDLRYIMCHDAKYDENANVVCPNCGMFNIKPVDYGKTSPNKRHLGDLFFVVVCLTPSCNTIFRYYVTPSYLGGNNHESD